MKLRRLLLLLSVFSFQHVSFSQSHVPLMVGTNGALIGIAGGGTSNFFLLNSNLLGQAITAIGITGGGGGGSSSIFDPTFFTTNGSGQISETGGLALTNHNVAPAYFAGALGLGGAVRASNGVSVVNSVFTTGNGLIANTSIDSAGNANFSGTIAAGSTAFALVTAQSYTNAENNWGADSRGAETASNLTVLASATIKTNLTVGGIISGGLGFQDASQNFTDDGQGNLQANSLRLYDNLTVEGEIFLGQAGDIYAMTNDSADNLYVNTTLFAGHVSSRVIYVTNNLTALGSSSLLGGGTFAGAWSGLPVTALPSSMVSPLIFTNVYTNTLTAPTSDFQLVGCTATYNSSGATLTYGAGPGLYQLTNHYTCANDYRVQFDAYIDSGGYIGFGIHCGYGLNGAVSGLNDLFWDMDANYSPSNVVNWWNGVSTSPTTLSVSALNYQPMTYAQPAFLNAWLHVTMIEFHGANYLTVSNKTTGAVLRLDHGQILTLTNMTPNISVVGGSGYPTLWVPGGTVIYANFGFDLIYPSNYLFLSIGDSIESGASSGTSYGGWPTYAADELKAECVAYGRGSDLTEHLMLCTNEIAALRPSLILNAIGGNDGSLTTNSSAFLGAIKAIAPVIDVTPTPRYGGFATPLYLINWEQTNGADYIDITTALETNGTLTLLPYFQADAPHPNDAGHRVVGTIVAGALRIRGY